FPTSINASSVNEIFLNQNSIDLSGWGNILYHPNASGTNILADTISIISEGTEVAHNYVTRSNDLAINTWLSGRDEGNGMEYTKQENIYNSNGKIEKINTYWGVDLNNLVLENVRKIAYNPGNDKVIADTIEYMDAGSVEFTESFDYTYD